jgi:predicted nucleic acid-binding protein
MALKNLVVPASRMAAERRPSVHDACYVALAEEADAVLLTADRDAAEAARESILMA